MFSQERPTRLLMPALVLVFLTSGQAFAQKPDGYVSVGLDALPNAPGSPIELRARLFADEKLTPFSFLTLRLAGSADGVIRGCHELVPETDTCRDARVIPQEAYAEFAGARGDLRVGYSRVVWGRLDEVQPTDVVNPLDLARFFFEGRSEARLPVAMVRGRLFFGERASIEALLVPQFRRGRFDQLGEPSSPFNLASWTEKGDSPPFHANKGDSPPFALAEIDGLRDFPKNLALLSTDIAAERGTVPLLTGTVPLMRREPATTWRNMQGGGRVSATTGRVDWSAAIFRGFDAYGIYLAPPVTTAVTQLFPRYTMVGADFETTRGAWALRGEGAHFSGTVDALDAGAGLDRRAGDYHVSGTVLVHREGGVSTVQPARTTTSLVAAADRTFARERYRTRTFGVYNVSDAALFLRNITSMEVRANVTVEGSVGWFFGTGSTEASREVIGRFSDRDFLYLRLRVHF